MSKTNEITAKKSKVTRKNAVSHERKKERLKTIDSPADQVLHLQQIVGNQAVQRLFKSRILQAKLKIGQPNDKYEQEADRVAEQVMQMPEPRISRQTEEKEEEELVQPKPIAEQITPFVQRQEEEPIQAKGNTSSTAELIPTIESSINSLKGSGQPLPESTRNYFEPGFGADFSGVKVHTGDKASIAAKTLNSRAFTIGNNIVFNSGNYSSTTKGGKKLLAHELTHVMQQASNPSSKIQRSIPISLKNQNPFIQRAPTSSASLPSYCKWPDDPASFTMYVAHHYLLTEYKINMNASSVTKLGYRRYVAWFKDKGVRKYGVRVDWWLMPLPPDLPSCWAQRIYPKPNGKTCDYDYQCDKIGNLILTKKGCW